MLARFKSTRVRSARKRRRMRGIWIHLGAVLGAVLGINTSAGGRHVRQSRSRSVFIRVDEEADLHSCVAGEWVIATRCGGCIVPGRTHSATEPIDSNRAGRVGSIDRKRIESVSCYSVQFRLACSTFRLPVGDSRDVQQVGWYFCASAYRFR